MTVRTPRINSIFCAIACLAKVSAKKNFGQSKKIDQNSYWVVELGVGSEFWEDVKRLIRF
jgi:hypothetical protein